MRQNSSRITGAKTDVGKGELVDVVVGSFVAAGQVSVVDKGGVNVADTCCSDTGVGDWLTVVGGIVFTGLQAARNANGKSTRHNHCWWAWV